MDFLINTLFWIVVSFFLLYVVAVITALKYNQKLKRGGYTGIPWEQCFHPKKHFSFLVGWVLSLIPRHIVVQYSIRFLSNPCQTCQDSGTCLNIQTGAKTCGCDPYKMACSPFESCKNSRYGPIIWNKEKAWEFINKVKPFVSFNKN